MTYLSLDSLLIVYPSGLIVSGDPGRSLHFSDFYFIHAGPTIFGLAHPPSLDVRDAYAMRYDLLLRAGLSLTQRDNVCSLFTYVGPRSLLFQTVLNTTHHPPSS
jgi:hypothetical protein